MKILYKPFALVIGLIGAKLGQSVFRSIWMQIDDAKPPKPTTADSSVPKVVGAAALEAATVAGVAAVVDRYGASAFAYLTGTWPGEQHAQRPDEDEKQS